MNKLTCLIILALLSSTGKIYPETPRTAQAARNGSCTASQLAWTSIGISLMVAVGIITALSISDNK